MKNSVRILIKAFNYYIFVLVFLVLSCSDKSQNDGNLTSKDSTYSESVNGQKIKTYNERLAEQSYLQYCK